MTAMMFDPALDAILSNVLPGDRICADCGATFLLEAADIELLKKLRVPVPTICWQCSRQRRLAFLNYTNLYKRKCDAPGHTEDVISAIPPGTDFPVYDYEHWNSYVWEPLSLGVVWNGGSFRDQFFDLLKRAPQPALTRHPGSVGSEYTLYGYEFKNCYYTFGGKKSENVHYSNWPADSKDSLDLMLAFNCTLCSNAVFLYNSYRCHYAYFSRECFDSDFLYDCRNMRNSFGCVNLRNKEYCFFNEQLTKEEYEKRRAEIDLNDREVVKKYQELFWNFVKENPVRAVWIEKSENVSGNFIVNSKKCHDVVRCLNSENIRHADFPMNSHDAMNVAVCNNGELLYESSGVATGSSRVKFSYQARTCLDSEFLANCRNVQYCFGCVGLENKKYCILNQQYTEEEYFKKVDEIKTAMLKAGEYGDFLPLRVSPYAYNGSLAGIVFPMTKEGVEKKKAMWHEEVQQNVGSLNAVKIADLPAGTRDLPEDILSKAIVGTSGKAFRMIPAELDFYKNESQALPEVHPYERMLSRFARMNNFRTLKVDCASCGAATDSMYSKDSGFTIYCDACFTKTVA